MDKVGQGEPAPATRDRLIWMVLRTSVPDVLEFCKVFGMDLGLDRRKGMENRSVRDLSMVI